MQAQSLSRRERQIMEIVYRLGEATAQQVLEAMHDPPSYSALRALMRILVEKQHLQHRADGPRYIYWPTVSRSKARAAALAGVVDNFFEGSAVRAAAALLGSMHGKKLTKDELEELNTIIVNARRQGR
ncbi:MAG TPA: BlaI/MecI/CopY family transcriptional regulator [Steroidobacteraceae bacterium]|jgi:predicted transcriptional regulator|nr:BlaI/MecI/CopY family transcriptional regulator [Steroidobacteraceae bacterium]